MRVAYVHGYDGVSGALLLGALLDAGAPLSAVSTGWQQLGLPEAQLVCTRSDQGAMQATQLTWAAPACATFLASHTPTTLRALLEASPVSPRVIQRLQRLLTRFMTAVAQVRGLAEDAAAIVQASDMPAVLYLGSAVACALEALAVDDVMAAPVVISTGCLATSPEGRVPLPRPLTMALCQGIALESVHRDTETTTVCGAALVTGLATHVGAMPGMTLLGTHYGATVTPPQQLQLMLGERTGPAAAERIAVIEANIDDMNPEFYETIMQRLFAQGALDVTLSPLFMKKNRPANTLTVLAPLAAVTALAQLMLQETSTFGVRVHEVWRHKLDRFHRQVTTRYGPVPVKCGLLEGRIVQAAPEYEACKHLALTHHVPVRLVYTEAASLAAAWLV